MSENCVFCRIIRGEAEAYMVYEDDDVVAFLDKYPVSRGHTLVVPKEHYPYIYEVPDPLLAKLVLVARDVARAQVRALGATGVRIVQNNGSDAGQVIFHVHFHVIPFYGAFRLLRRRLERKEGEEVSDALRRELRSIRG